MRSEFPFSVYEVDRGGVPYEVARCSTPIAAIDARQVRAKVIGRAGIAMIAHDDLEEWLGDDDVLEMAGEDEQQAWLDAHVAGRS